MAILIIDDEIDAARALKKLLERKGYQQISVCSNGTTAFKLLAKDSFDIVLLDLMLPDIHGLDILKKIRHETPETEYIILTAVDDLDTAVKAIRLGAYDYLVKPVDPNRLLITLEHTFEKISYHIKNGDLPGENKVDQILKNFGEFITVSEKMTPILAYASAVAKSNVPVLISGESGTGKELFARAIHRQSPYSKGPFVAVNMASIPESLFESQLFGHKKGSFTGAGQDFPGYFRMAHGGTLFLDEIGEIPPHLQVKLLRVIEDQKVNPLGDSRFHAVDCRIISATNRNIDEAVKEGRLRLDLLYRLKSAHVELLPLRQRTEDIPVIAKYYLEKFAAENNKEVKNFSPEALHALCQFDFPGNVRQLSRMIQTAVLISPHASIRPEDLGISPSASDQNFSLPTLKENSDRYIKKIIQLTDGNKKLSAQILGISLRQLQRRLAQLK